MTPALAARLAVPIGMAVLWLALGTQPSLPDYERREEGWSGDFRSYYLPNAAYAGERLAAGELPLWNPHQGLGDPFLATLQVGALYPPNWLHALLPAPTAFLLLAVLHLALAAFAAGLLASALGAGALGSTVAAIVYAGSWKAVASIYSPPVQYAGAWAPLLFFAVDRLIAGVRYRRIVTLAGTVAMMLLCGWPYALAISSVGAALYGGVLLVARAARERRVPAATIAALLAAVVAGALLAAPQVLPTRELLARSCRALETVVEGQAIFAQRPHDPAVFWRILTKQGFNDGVPGLAAAALSLFAVFLPGVGRARAALLLGVGAVGLLVSFPNDVPVYGWLRELPLLGDFRFPFRYRSLATLAISVAAGVGAAHACTALSGKPAVARVTGAASLLICLATIAVPTYRKVLPFPRAVATPPSLAEELRAHGVDVSSHRHQRVYWAERANKRGRDQSVDLLYDMEPMSLARTAEIITYFETGMPRTLLSLPDELDARRARGDTIAAPFYGRLGIPTDGSRAAILDLLSIRWIATPDPPAWLVQRYPRVSAPDAEISVFENPRALPRVYRVPGAVRTPPRLRAAMRGMAGSAFDPRRQVLLEEPPPGLLANARAGVRDPTASAEIEHYAEQEIAIRTTGDRDGVVVLTDAWYPGWEARLDGVSVAVLRANTAFRGIVVPPGEHRIELRYRSSSLRTGVLLALLAAAALAAGARFRSPGVDGAA